MEENNNGLGNDMANNETNANEIQEVEETKTEDIKVEEEPKAEEETKPEEEPKAEEEAKPEEEPKAEEEVKPEEEPKAEEETKPEEEPKAEDESKPREVKPGIPAEGILAGMSEEERRALTEGISKEEKPPKEKKDHKKFWKGFGLSLLGVIVVCYIASVIFFSNHFYFNTTVYGMDVSLKSVSQVRNEVNTKTSEYKLDLVEIDGSTESISATDANMNITVTDNFKDMCKKQNPFIWVVSIFKDYNYDIEATAEYDEDMLADAIRSLDCMNSLYMQNPVNPTFKYVDGEFVIVPEVEGDTIIKENLDKAIGDSLTSCKAELVLDKADCYKKPEYTKEDGKVLNCLDELNDYKDFELTYKFGDMEIVLAGDELASWMKISDSYAIKLDEEKVAAYVEDFAEKYNTVKTDRNFTTNDGKTIKVYGKYFGWELDQEAETEKLLNNIKSKKQVSRSPIWLQEGENYNAENDIGDTYIEVDLTNQKVYGYIDGSKVVETDCVSGSIAAGHATPGGLYQIKYKASPAVLRGDLLPDGSYSYESYVVYWMPFNGGIGLHDADGWRSKYGGEIYLRSGSHGCVNLPRKDAKSIYEKFDVGTPVVCYYRDND